jgi:hypothetical protein
MSSNEPIQGNPIFSRQLYLDRKCFKVAKCFYVLDDPACTFAEMVPWYCSSRSAKKKTRNLEKIGTFSDLGPLWGKGGEEGLKGVNTIKRNTYFCRLIRAIHLLPPSINISVARNFCYLLLFLSSFRGFAGRTYVYVPVVPVLPR